MGKRTDQAFHLTVATLALTFVVISAGTVVYQDHPQWMQQLLKQTNLVGTGSGTGNTGAPDQTTSPRGANANQGSSGPTSVKGVGTNRTPSNSTGARTTDNTTPNAASKAGGVASDIVDKPAYKSINNNIYIKVKAVGANTAPSDVKYVQDTLNKYQIVQLVSSSLQMNAYQQVNVLVAKTSADYGQGLSTLGVSGSDTAQFTQDTGGFAQGSTIVIPLYQNKTTADLANTLSHELTHAFLNLNVGSFPSWMNEGLAVTDGMTAQHRVESAVAYGGYARQMAESIVDAQRKGTLWPLAADESKVLSGTAPYDLELQDWLAVRDLVNLHGLSAFSDYFYRLNIGESQDVAFARSFGSTEPAFNTAFTSQLKNVGTTPDQGAHMTFSVPGSFHGAIRFLEHGTTRWTGFRPTAGQTSITIAPDGTVTHATKLTAPIEDSNPADKTTLYINLDPNQPLTYNGQKVKDSGFAIDYHYGLYGFVNAWITLTNGKSFYFHKPTLFGVTINQITEQKADPWLLGLLSPPADIHSVPVTATTSAAGVS